MSKGRALLWQDPHLLLTPHADVGLPGSLPSTSQPCAHGQQRLLPPGCALGQAPRCSRRRDSGSLAGVSDSPCPQLSAGGFDPPMPSTTTPSGAVWHPVPTGLVTGASLMVPRNIGSPAPFPLLARTGSICCKPRRSPGAGAPNLLPPGARGPPQGSPARLAGLPKSRGCGGEG